MSKAWVYILECSDGSYYTGCTTDVGSRISQHKHGTYGGYTASRRPVKVRWTDEFPSVDQAVSAERMIKGWTRAKKEALMKGDFDALKRLAECKNESHYRKRRVLS